MISVVRIFLGLTTTACVSAARPKISQQSEAPAVEVAPSAAFERLNQRALNPEGLIVLQRSCSETERNIDWGRAQPFAWVGIARSIEATSSRAHEPAFGVLRLTCE